jgi:hypothetical protein
MGLIVELNTAAAGRRLPNPGGNSVMLFMQYYGPSRETVLVEVTAFERGTHRRRRSKFDGARAAAGFTMR